MACVMIARRRARATRALRIVDRLATANAQSLSCSGPLQTLVPDGGSSPFPPNMRYSAPTLARRLAFRHRLPHWMQVRPDLGVAVVYVGTKLQCAIAIDKRGLVNHECRHVRRQIASGGAARRDRLIDRFDRLLD